MAADTNESVTNAKLDLILQALENQNLTIQSLTTKLRDQKEREEVRKEAGNIWQQITGGNHEQHSSGEH